VFAQKWDGRTGEGPAWKITHVRAQGGRCVTRGYDRSHFELSGRNIKNQYHTRRNIPRCEGDGGLTKGGESEGHRLWHKEGVPEGGKLNGKEFDQSGNAK